ncbi:MAG: hypothetical protein GX591_17055 [Planctomycetes bacterium]|nr:hypothetical protein [Planctomycetota bacterium]
MNAMRTAVAGLVCLAVFSGAAMAAEPAAAAEGGRVAPMDPAKAADWLARWEKNILASAAANRSCDTSMGEDIGWFMTPYMEGFCYGYLATGDTKWIDMLFDWADSWIKRAVKEPDGYLGWPKGGAAGTAVDSLDDYNADSLLGEAMVLRPLVILSAQILKDPKLKAAYGQKAAGYIALSEQIFQKWTRRGAWRDTANGGAVSLVMPYGLDPATGAWTAGYETRNAPNVGFSHPNNKANHVARWLLAMSDATGKPQYRQLAEKWFRLMKSRMTATEAGTYRIWNYWEPAGPWDYKPDGQPKHWVGVHPNAGYYSIDVTGIVDAYEHGIVFTRADIDRLVATALAEKRYWGALMPYSKDIQDAVEAGIDPATWGGMSATPAYLARQKQR